MIRAVVFDLFDTLMYTTETGTREQAMARLREAGVSDEAWRRGARAAFTPALRGELRSLEERVYAMLQGAGQPEPDPVLVGEVASLLDARHEYHLYPDTLVTLEGLRRRGFGLGLASNITSDETRVVEACGLRGVLDAAVLSCEVGHVKPEPEIYRLAAKCLKVAPEECVFVDDITDYVEGALRAGMTGVRIDRPGLLKDKARDRRYALRIAGLAELLAWLPARAGADQRQP